MRALSRPLVDTVLSNIQVNIDYHDDCSCLNLIRKEGKVINYITIKK